MSRVGGLSSTIRMRMAIGYASDAALGLGSSRVSVAGLDELNGALTAPQASPACEKQGVHAKNAHFLY
jgi:hypothetical protein